MHPDCGKPNRDRAFDQAFHRGAVGAGDENLSADLGHPGVGS
jgi:hypothetical protein